MRLVRSRSPGKLGLINIMYYKHTYARKNTHILTHTHTHEHKQTHIHTNTCTRIHTQTRTYSLTHTNIHAQKHTHAEHIEGSLNVELAVHVCRCRPNIGLIY